MSKQYLSGRRWEYEIIKYLETQGYYCLRSAGSHRIDIVAFLIKSDFEVPLIRCISAKYGHNITKKEFREFRNLPLPANISKEIWYKPRRGLSIIKEVN